MGEIALSGGFATINTGEDYYYLSPEDTKYVLEELWGNPPSEDMTMGMVFPSTYLPLEAESWAMVVDYDPMGYVSDEDAASYDYDALLRDMQNDTKESNKEREELGYGTVDLIGWAEPPHYDSEDKKLYWAKELHFSGLENNTLNYDIRALGRKGVLIMSVVGDMSSLDKIRGAAPDLLAMTQFNDGSRYVDFDPSVDTVAAVGIGGLIAGKVAAKTGLLAVGLIFLKKAWFLLLIPLVGLKNLIFGRKNEE